MGDIREMYGRYTEPVREVAAEELRAAAARERVEQLGPQPLLEAGAARGEQLGQLLGQRGWLGLGLGSGSGLGIGLR